ncbi:DUF4123 domain-containing protein [Pseudomonas koreensis]|uniref:DUF4123 domain-containing protein n=1 Tax=Pseudomonas koreensis TaxID=198620 RepID=UPI0021C6B9BB|nr:DUF4123 domain-containing protein [Pseudomonas koreensis]MCU0071875.1 DUF4123 domain-containing protein [Pseudomonas koreensis]
MSAATPGQHAQWLLLDSAQAPQALTTLRQGFAGVRRQKLFEGTEFQPVSEQGPLLIDLRECMALSALCHTDPQTWCGLLLGSDATTESLRAHLQRMLTVSVGVNHRALLNYYDRQTASYFFDACDARQLSCWLGPIKWLRWFGGTWADRASGSLGWQQLRNPGLDVEPLQIEQGLTRHQREHLHRCLLEQHVWRWSQSTGTDYRTLSSHLEQGLSLGFSDRAVLDDWLWLRLQHPRAEVVQPPQGLTQQERLEHLRRRWQNNQP